MSPILWLALKPIQHRHIDVFIVRTGEILLILTCSSGSRGVRTSPLECISEVRDTQGKEDACTQKK
jgi:hypothetical protein